MQKPNRLTQNLQSLASLMERLSEPIWSTSSRDIFARSISMCKEAPPRESQSSCPFKNARQKVFGLGYSLLVFVYDKSDDHKTRTGTLNILHTVFIEARRTADYQTTRGILNIIENEGNEDDIVAFMQDHLLPVEEIQASLIAREILAKPPEIGYLTISNALQWRLQYKRVIEEAGKVDGIRRLN